MNKEIQIYMIIQSHHKVGRFVSTSQDRNLSQIPTSSVNSKKVFWGNHYNRKIKFEMMRDTNK